VQGLPLMPKLPQGHGFMAATRMKLAGNRAEPLARETVTTLSSSGWRKASTVLESNSGNSSRKRTPLCANVISPGLGMLPPPTIEM
jgi:hypothetical protein